MTINVTNPDSEPTSYLVYQTLQGTGPSHLLACFDANLPENTEVGLVLAQGLDNGELQTPWVRVVRTGSVARAPNSNQGSSQNYYHQNIVSKVIILRQQEGMN